MTYNVLMGTLNPTHSLTHPGHIIWLRAVESDLKQYWALAYGLEEGS